MTAQTLPMLLGFDATLVTGAFSASAKLLTEIKPAPVTMPAAPPATGAYAIGPESYGVFQIVSRLQKQGIPTFRAAAQFTDAGRAYPAGTFIVPPTDAARQILQNQSRHTGIPISAISTVPRVAGAQLKPGTRIGMLKPANNIQSGWLMWMFDQYGVNYSVVKAQDYKNLAGRFDAIVMPTGVSRNSITNGLNRNNYPAEWSWAFGVGEDGWNKLRDFVTGGGTLVAFGSGANTAQQLFELPLRSILPDDESVFYCPGALLSQEIDTNDPVAWGMDPKHPTWFDGDRAYELTDPDKYPVHVVAKYPNSGEQLQSGWLIGGEYLNGAANGLSWSVGSGYVVTFASEIAFRTWNRGEEKMVFNAMYHGPSQKLTPEQFERLGR